MRLVPNIGGPGSIPFKPVGGLHFGRSSFAIPSVDRDIKPLVYFVIRCCGL